MFCKIIKFGTLAYVAVSFFTGCATTNKSTAIVGSLGAVARDSNAFRTVVHEHLWEPVYTENQNHNSNYGVYTYVLLNQDLQNDEASERYKLLVSAIQSSTSLHIKNDTTSSETNMFLLPYQKDKSLNTTLSKKMLNIFAKVTKSEKLRQLLVSRPGPFMISTPLPLSKLKGNSDIPILYVDMSTVNNTAIKEIVAAYKMKLVIAPISTEEEFKSIRLTILNLILNGNDCISIVKTAYAELK